MTYPDQPGWRSGATGETAQRAADAMKASAPTLEQLSLAELAAGPLTPEEIKPRVEAVLGRPVLLTSIRPRLSAAKAKGLVKDSGLRRPGEGGRCMAVAWALTNAEERALFAARKAAEQEHGGGQ